LYAEIDDSRTIPDVPINKGYLTKITAERARRERPDFIAPGTTNEVQKKILLAKSSFDLNQASAIFQLNASKLEDLSFCL
jgi:hypothetical protein